MFMNKRRALAGLGAMAMTLGGPAALVLATSAPAHACIFAVSTAGLGTSPSCGGVGTATYSLSAAPSTVATGDPVTLHLAETVAGGSPIDVTSRATFSIDDGSCTANVCTPDTAGWRTISARVNAIVTATQIATITPDHLVIAGPPTAAVGQPVAYNAYHETAVGALIDDVTDLATVTLGGAACPGAVCTATSAGQQTVRATLNGLTAETTLVVGTGPTASLVVIPQVTDFWNNAHPATFTAEAYDAWGNDIGDVTPQSSFAISPDGSCTGNLCTPGSGGSHTVTATDGPVSGTVTLDAAGIIPTVAPVLPAGQVGTPYSASVLASGDESTWTTADDPSTLPPGLTLGQHGTLSGTPTAAGTYTFFVSAVNDNGGQNEPTTITIAPGTLPSKPTVSIDDASVQEGRHGRTAVHVTVSLSAPSTTLVRVAWHTVNGSAVRGTDYYARHGTITIPAGRTTAQITVYVLGDRTHEQNETFHIALTQPRGATLGTARDTVTVVDDD
jgi:hypothetical protein